MKTPALLLSIVIKAYQWVISPLLGQGCRFEPSCSHYAQEALIKRGVIKGGLLSLKRLLRCHPWGGNGFDPVP